MTLRPLTYEEVEEVREWRNGSREGLRTPHMITQEEQTEFFEDVICNPSAPHRYWAAEVDGNMVAMVGLTDIQWETGCAEISLIVDPELRRQHVGTEAVAAVLSEAFDVMGLLTVYGEAYECNKGIRFWYKIASKYRAETVRLPRRKFWGGKLWGSFYFSISVETWHGKTLLDPATSDRALHILGDYRSYN